MPAPLVRPPRPTYTVWPACSTSPPSRVPGSWIEAARKPSDRTTPPTPGLAAHSWRAAATSSRMRRASSSAASTDGSSQAPRPRADRLPCPARHPQAGPGRRAYAPRGGRGPRRHPGPRQPGRDTDGRLQSPRRAVAGCSRRVTRDCSPRLRANCGEQLASRARTPAGRRCLFPRELTMPACRLTTVTRDVCFGPLTRAEGQHRSGESAGFSAVEELAQLVVTLTMST